jgi:hypothetical protein
VELENKQSSRVSYDVNIRAADVETEEKEAQIGARPAEPESLASKVKRVLRFLGALLDL